MEKFRRAGFNNTSDYFYISNPYGNGRSLVCTPSPGKKKRVKKTKAKISEIRSKRMQQRRP